MTPVQFYMFVASQSVPRGFTVKFFRSLETVISLKLKFTTWLKFFVNKHEKVRDVCLPLHKYHAAR